MHGGRAQALQQAIEYKVEYERQHPSEYPSGAPRQPFRAKPQRNSKTGINAVSETVNTTRTGERCRCFSVNYTLDGTRHNKRPPRTALGARGRVAVRARMSRVTPP